MDGHFYSVKRPGMAALSAPLYMAHGRLGGRELAADAAVEAAKADHPHWIPNDVPPNTSVRLRRRAGQRVQVRVEDETPIVWALTLIAAVIPAVLLLLGVRWAADRFEPGYGTAAAITLGPGDDRDDLRGRVLLARDLGRPRVRGLRRADSGERRAPRGSGSSLAAGLLAGLAVTFEFQTGLVGAVLFFYALARDGRLRRGAAYAGGAAGRRGAGARLQRLGVRQAAQARLQHAVAVLGTSGHASLGLNSDGFFGITLPRLDPCATCCSPVAACWC